MEGSFGNRKLHHGRGCIHARNVRSEVLQIFFGIHMANAAVRRLRPLRNKRNGGKASAIWHTLLTVSDLLEYLVTTEPA